MPFQTVTRTGTVKTCKQTVFFPWINGAFADAEDDVEKNCTLKNATDAKRIANVQNVNASFTDPATTGKLYINIDGKNATPSTTSLRVILMRVMTKTKHWKLKGQDPTYTGDTCDLELFETIGDMDAGPLVDWFGIDVRTWADGDTHTFEFGSLNECYTAKYIS